LGHLVGFESIRNYGHKLTWIRPPPFFDGSWCFSGCVRCPIRRARFVVSLSTAPSLVSSPFTSDFSFGHFVASFCSLFPFFFELARRGWPGRLESTKTGQSLRANSLFFVFLLLQRGRTVLLEVGGGGGGDFSSHITLCCCMIYAFIFNVK